MELLSVFDRSMTNCESPGCAIMNDLLWGRSRLWSTRRSLSRSPGSFLEDRGRRRHQAQFPPQPINLPQLKGMDPNPSPSLRHSDQGSEGQLQAALLIEETRNHLASPFLLLKGPLQQIRRPNHSPVGHRTTQMAQASLQVFRKGFHRRRIKILILLQHLLGSLSSNFIGRSLKDRTKVSLYLRNRLRGKLIHNVSDLMHQAPLPQTPGPHLFNGPNQSRSTVGSDHQRDFQPPLHQVPQKILPVLVRFLIAQRQMKQDSRSLPGDPPGHQDPFLRTPIQSHRLIDGIQKKINHLKPAQLSLTKGLILLPERLGQFTDGTAGHDPLSMKVLKEIFNVSGRKPPGIHFLNQMLQKGCFSAHQRKHPGLIGLHGLSQLGYLDLYRALRRLQALRLVAVPIPSMRPLVWVSLVVTSTQMIGYFLFQSFLQKVLNPFLHQFRQEVSFSRETLGEQRRNLLSYLFRGWYLFHGHGLLSIPILGMGFR